MARSSLAGATISNAWAQHYPASRRPFSHHRHGSDFDETHPASSAISSPSPASPVSPTVRRQAWVERPFADVQVTDRQVERDEEGYSPPAYSRNGLWGAKSKQPISMSVKLEWECHPSLGSPASQAVEIPLSRNASPSGGGSDGNGPRKSFFKSTLNYLKHANWNRPKVIYHCLFKREAEKLKGEWPQAFGLPSKPVDTGLGIDNLGFPRTSTASSQGSSHPQGGLTLQTTGLGLSPPPKLLPEYYSHISHLNTLIPSHLVKTRMVLALLELFNYIMLALIIIGLAVQKGKQGGLLQAAEVLVVLAVIGNAAGVNWCRINRWRLNSTLRSLARDWSPSPVAHFGRFRPGGVESRNDDSDPFGGASQGMNPHRRARGNGNGTGSNGRTNNRNNQGTAGFEMTSPRSVEEARWRNGAEETGQRRDGSARREDPEEGPKLRWYLGHTEGGWWTSYRPIIKVELIVPPTPSSKPPVFIPISPTMSSPRTVDRDATIFAPGAASPPAYEGQTADFINDNAPTTMS